MKEKSMFDECLRALWDVGCTIIGEAGSPNGWTVIFPDGEERKFSEPTFKLICYRVYQEVMA